MCTETKTALKVLISQPGRGGLSEAAALVFGAVVEDTMKMETRMSNLEKDVGYLKTEVSSMSSKLDNLIERFNKPSWLSRFWEKHGEKIVLFLLVSLAAFALKIAMPELIDLWKALT